MIRSVRFWLGVVAALVIGGAIYSLATRDDREHGAEQMALRAGRTAAQVAGQSGRGGAPVAPVVEGPASLRVDDELRMALLSEPERKMVRAGLKREQIEAMKEAFPDWRARFDRASPDMIKAEAKRVQHLVPEVIPDELAVGLGKDAPPMSQWMDDAARNAGGTGDDAAHALRGAGGAGVLDDVARGGGSVVDDVARHGAGFGDDLLRLLGLGAAGAGAAGAAALKSKKKP